MAVPVGERDTSRPSLACARNSLVHTMNHSFSVEHAVKYGIEEAILIGNFQFWIAKNRADQRNIFDGRTWTYNTASAFSELIPYFNAKKIYRLLESLVEQGVIMKGNYNEHPRDRTQWFAFVNEAEFLPETDLYKKAKAPAKKPAEKLAGKGSLPFPKNGKCISQKRELHFPEMGNAIPENGKSLYRTDITTDVNADNTPQPPTADAAGECASGAGRKAKAATPASPEFEAAWQAYPPRPGNSKVDALKAWKARVAAGASEQAMLDGVRSYAAYCAAMKTESRYVKLASTFFGPGNHYAADWSVPSDADQGSFFDDMDHSNNIEAL